ncbi:MAG: ATP-binding protein [Cyanobacteria bacterium P01_G01_bin.67]
MKKKVDFESVLLLVDKAISPTYLNPTQEIVLREVWNGKTYSKMAYDYNYDPEYIKTVGCNLWQTLSRAFDEQINKSNFVPFMRQRLSLLVEEKKNQPQDGYFATAIAAKSSKRQFCSWTTAPNIQHFLGREQELETLNTWSQNPDCRLIVVSGMTGSGKTTLVTEFANSVKEQFDWVIWFSLSQLPSLNKLLNNYLKIINCQTSDSIDSKPQELSFMLSEFIECLRRQRVLLVLDGLQHILDTNQTSVLYKENFEGYGQFLRSIISTDHQSLLITTTRIKPKLLEYYASNQVKFLDLRGFSEETTISFFNTGTEDSDWNKQELLYVSETLQNNPQLLKIANNHLDVFTEVDAEQVIEDLSMLEAISDLLDQELSYLSNLDKEIIYWLAISGDSLSLAGLTKQIKHSESKIKFLHSIKSLVERSLIIKNQEQNIITYSLMPIMKIHLRRKLVRAAL